MKKTKLFITGFFILAGLAFLGACGGSETSSEEGSATEESSATASESEVINTDAKSESKGIGKFTNVEVAADIDADMAAKGQAIFETKCTPCHKLTDEKLVGPGLKNITEIRTPEWIMNMITNPEEMTKKDPVAKALFEEHLMQMTFQNVSDEETRQILEYFRVNDKN